MYAHCATLPLTYIFNCCSSVLILSYLSLKEQRQWEGKEQRQYGRNSLCCPERLHLSPLYQRPPLFEHSYGFKIIFVHIHMYVCMCICIQRCIDWRVQLRPCESTHLGASWGKFSMRRYVQVCVGIFAFVCVVYMYVETRF